MPKATKRRLLLALTAVMAALLCAPNIAPGKALDPSKTAPGDFWSPEPERVTLKLVRIPGSQRFDLAATTPTAPGRPKWLSRDPLGEAGGLNLYGFVGNDPVNNYDYLGLDTVWVDTQTGVVKWVVHEPGRNSWIRIGKVPISTKSHASPSGVVFTRHPGSTVTLDGGGTASLDQLKEFAKIHSAHKVHGEHWVKYPESWAEFARAMGEAGLGSGRMVDISTNEAAIDFLLNDFRDGKTCSAGRLWNRPTPQWINDMRQNSGAALGAVSPTGRDFGAKLAESYSPLPFISGGRAYRLFRATSNAPGSAGRMGSLVEANAARRLAEMEAANPGAHFFGRHGAATTIEAQHIRATTGLTPDGFAGRAVDSSRFFSNQLQLNATQRAQTIFQQTGKNSFSFDMGTMVGEGFTRGGGELIRTTNVQAVFRNGQLYTMFPKLSPIP